MSAGFGGLGNGQGLSPTKPIPLVFGYSFQPGERVIDFRSKTIVKSLEREVWAIRNCRRYMSILSQHFAPKFACFDVPGDPIPRPKRDI